MFTGRLKVNRGLSDFFSLLKMPLILESSDEGETAHKNIAQDFHQSENDSDGNLVPSQPIVISSYSEVQKTFKKRQIRSP